MNSGQNPIPCSPTLPIDDALGVKHYYFALLPYPDQQGLSLNKSVSLKKMRTVVASSPAVLRYREQYLQRLAHHDRGYMKSVPSTQVNTWVWRENDVNVRHQPTLRKMLANLNSQSRFSISVPCEHGHVAFLKLFLDIPETDLKAELSSRSDYWCDQLMPVMHDLTVKHIEQINPLANFNVLSPTCIKILQMVADGDSSQEISQKLHLTERGINYHLDRARVVVGAKNRIHLISLAHRLGVLANRQWDGPNGESSNAQQVR